MSSLKLFGRFSHIMLNGFRSTLAPILSFLLSYIVIKGYSKNLWGEFVAYLLYFFVASLILNWGGKEYLLRQFSLHPSKIINNWQEFLIARIPILLIILFTIPVFFSWQATFFMTIWVVAGFFTNAFTPIYLYKRDYLKVIIAEILSFIVLALLIYKQSKEMNVYTLGNYYAIYLLVKTLFFTVIYFPFFKFQKIKFNAQILLLALPFLLLSLTGFFQSKIDLYVFAIFHKEALLAEYQIISGFFIFTQSIATIMLLPYVKNVYRMQAKGLQKTSRLLGLSGIIINVLTVLAIYFALKYFFSINLTFLQVILGYVIGLPSYFYAVRVFYLFKEHQEKKVLIVSVLSLFINLTLSVILLYFKWEITGVLIANAAAQVTCLLLYLQFELNDKTA